MMKKVTDESIAMALANLSETVKNLHAICQLLPEGGNPELAAKICNYMKPIKIGSTGYVFVIDSKAKYIVSKDGKQDGEVIWDAKDSNGNYFVQDIVKTALALEPGRIGELRYPWSNPGDQRPRMKLSLLAYYKPLDWVIGAGSCEEEILETATLLERLENKNTLLILSVQLLILFLVVFLCFLIARSVANTLTRLTDRLR